MGWVAFFFTEDSAYVRAYVRTYVPREPDREGNLTIGRGVVYNVNYTGEN